MFDWFFRNRHTGEITIAQFPNAPLGLFLAATAVGRLAGPTGTPGAAVRLLGLGALSWWALDEVFRGVNPWRRLLGGAVLGAAVFRWLAS